MKPHEVFVIQDEEVDLYINNKPFTFRKSIMFIPNKELVDIFSIGVASQIASHCSVQLIEVDSSDSDLHGVKAFAINLEGDVADYYKINRKKKKTYEEEYDLAKQKLLSAVSMLFEAKKRFARNVLCTGYK